MVATVATSPARTSQLAVDGTAEGSLTLTAGAEAAMETLSVTLTASALPAGDQTNFEGSTQGDVSIRFPDDGPKLLVALWDPDEAGPPTFDDVDGGGTLQLLDASACPPARDCIAEAVLIVRAREQINDPVEIAWEVDSSVSVPGIAPPVGASLEVRTSEAGPLPLTIYELVTDTRGTVGLEAGTPRVVDLQLDYDPRARVVQHFSDATLTVSADGLGGASADRPGISVRVERLNDHDVSLMIVERSRQIEASLFPLEPCHAACTVHYRLTFSTGDDYEGPPRSLTWEFKSQVMLWAAPGGLLPAFEISQLDT
jgi:hypothetical protein